MAPPPVILDTKPDIPEAILRTFPLHFLKWRAKAIDSSMDNITSELAMLAAQTDHNVIKIGNLAHHKAVSADSKFLLR